MENNRTPSVILAERRTKAIEEAEKHSAELYSVCERIRDIDTLLAHSTYEMFECGDNASAVAEVVMKIKNLREERKKLITESGHPADYDTPKFVCEKCKDTGFVKLDKCECLKALEARFSVSETTIGKGLERCTFDTVDEKYFSDISMKSILSECKRYAERFSLTSDNLLFYGGTGLGKTHFAGAIANAVLEKGYTVIYESAVQVVSDLRKSFLGFDTPSDDYFDADLLIIDDLGTEVKTDYTVSMLTELINKRTVFGRPTIISTNFALDALQKTYGDRLASRILGEYRTIHFIGKDVRMLKKMQ